ncbi:hypothetical protein chiPu_0008699 [Chiloscyllium punctatum]|uniref:Rho-GAP domain-containing protein n=1 Tax=Chiloscyllium punctatum TaxID=137246 RepID=A0A401SIP1_CHIPU|nr:hypothetical protein [Chiloscyllium punctatum]
MGGGWGCGGTFHDAAHLKSYQLLSHSLNTLTFHLFVPTFVQFENRIEPTRRATCVTHKRLLSCLHGQQGSDFDKRLKKMPLMLLSQSIEDSCRELDNESPIRKMMELCCSVENTLAKVLIEHELQVERDVLDPLYKLSEEELPNVLKHKKQLAKLTLDWTAAKNRLNQATKSGNQGTPVSSTTTKLDLLKEDVEEMWRRVELSKDEYAADLYHFASKEEEYSNYFYSLMEAQADYHRKSLRALDAAMPTVRPSPSPSGGCSGKPAFGQPLEEHLKTCEREIALPIEACVMMLLEKGMKEEGLFRLAAAASVLKRLKSALDSGTFDPDEFKSDPHAVAGALKSYLRELPQPLMTFDLYDEWFQAASEKDLPKKVERLREVCTKLPPESYNNLRYLIKFLAKLAEYQEVNKMSPSNIAIVLGPNLLWPRDERKVSLMDMASASSVQVVTVMEPIIQNAERIFPEAKKPAPTRPTFPPPQQPKASLPWTSNPVCAPLTLPVDEKGGLTRRVSTDPAWGLSANPPAGATSSVPGEDKTITVRRATTGMLRAPCMPPPPVPHTHQRAASMDSPHSKVVTQQGVPEDPVRDLQGPTPEMVTPPPRCYQVGWSKQPQPLPRSRVYSVNPTMLSRVNTKVNDSSSGEEYGPQEQPLPATTEGTNEQC